MRLPQFDQCIEVRWGEAAQLAYAIAWVLCQQLEGRPTVVMALCFVPLTRVRSRLVARARQEQHHVGTPSKKPRKYILRYDEVAALMLILPIAPAAGLVWGEIQQASLRLERFIDFTPPS